jgi:hypothetical protein
MADRRTPDATLIEAVRILSRTIHTDDGVIPACLAEVSTRLEELVEERRSISTLLQKLESLEEQIARLREERRWVSVWERLPGRMQTVLVWSDLGFHTASLDSFGQWLDDDENPGKKITHWIPLPPGPEGEA